MRLWSWIQQVARESAAGPVPPAIRQPAETSQAVIDRTGGKRMAVKAADDAAWSVHGMWSGEMAIRSAQPAPRSALAGARCALAGGRMGRATPRSRLAGARSGLAGVRCKLAGLWSAGATVRCVRAGMWSGRAAVRCGFAGPWRRWRGCGIPSAALVFNDLARFRRSMGRMKSPGTTSPANLVERRVGGNLLRRGKVRRLDVNKLSMLNPRRLSQSAKLRWNCRDLGALAA